VVALLADALRPRAVDHRRRGAGLARPGRPA
jgi:hypothetical protein